MINVSTAVSEDDLTVHVHQSEMVDAPWPVARASVTDPEIADVQILTPQKVLLQGKTIGSTDLILWSKEEQAWKATVHVDVDVRRIETELRKYPKATLRLDEQRTRASGQSSIQ